MDIENTFLIIVGVSVGIFVLGLLGSIVLSIFYNVNVPSQGEHTGYISAVDYSKPFPGFKSNIVYFKTDPQSTQEDKYCVVDENVLKELKIAQKERQMVTISYENGWFIPNKICYDGTSVIKEVIK